MMNLTSPERVREDCRLIGQTLLKLALPRLIRRTIVVIIAVVIWLLVARWLLAYGKTVNYGFLQGLGPQPVELLGRINPYLWWLVTGVWSLIVFFTLRGWWAASLARGRATPVQPEVLADLAPNLSDEVLSVMRWTWGTREEPFTMGDLQRSLAEVRSGRIHKLAIVQEQADALDASAGRPARADRAPDAQPRAKRYSEPRIEPRA